MTIEQLKEKHYEVAENIETSKQCSMLNTNISIQFAIEQLEDVLKPNTGFLYQNLHNKISELKSKI